MRARVGTPGLCAGVLLAALGGCDEGAARGGAYSDHEELSDLEPYEGTKVDGVLTMFDRNLIVDDALFENADALTAEAAQAMLEMTPYGKRSFLADEVVGGKPFSQALVEVASSRKINPVMLLVRLQVEKSLISKSTRPTGNAVDFALGCGCPDGRACNETFRGIDKQLACGADTMRKHFDGSVAGTGQWAKGDVDKTLDKLSIAPQSHATASLYAYTPWVLEGQGGNWLIWNVTKKYLGNVVDRGLYDTAPDEPEPMLGSCMDRCGSTQAVPQGDGQACFCDADCMAIDDCCADWAELCSDGEPDPDPEPEPDPEVWCVDRCGSTDPVPDGQGGSCYCDEACVGSQDCCPDHADACPTEDPEPEPSWCAGICGSSEGVPDGAGGTCYCDDLCADNGDCCPDYDTAC